MTTERIEVLAVMEQAERSMFGAGSSVMKGRISEARAAVAALIEAAGNYATRYAMDEASVDGDEHTGCSHRQHIDAVALFAAIARVGGKP